MAEYSKNMSLFSRLYAFRYFMYFNFLSQTESLKILWSKRAQYWFSPLLPSRLPQVSISTFSAQTSLHSIWTITFTKLTVLAMSSNLSYLCIFIYIKNKNTGPNTGEATAPTGYLWSISFIQTELLRKNYLDLWECILIMHVASYNAKENYLFVIS